MFVIVTLRSHIKMSTSIEEKVKVGSRVLVVNPSNSYWSLFLTSEVALRAQNLGAEVTWINVARKQSKKFEVNKNDLLPRWRYQNLAKKVTTKLKAEGILIGARSPVTSENFHVPSFSSIAELRRYRIHNINLGAMIFSSVSSALKTTSFEVSYVRNFIRHYLKSANHIYHNVNQIISESMPDLIITINDRILGSALTLAIAEEKGITHSVVYFGSQINSTELYENSLYDADEWQAKVQEHWLRFPPSDQELITVEKKIEELASGPSKDSQKYLLNQKSGHVPKWQGRTIVFYAQSEYEHSAYFIPEVSNRFANQYEAFTCLQEVAKSNGYRLILKYHPYPIGVKFKNLKKRSNVDWSSVKIDQDVIQLNEESEVDTYELIINSDLNVVWSSTVGLESLARSRPTLVLGNTQWLNMEWGIHVWNRENIESFFKNDFPTFERSVLFKWYWYLDSFGNPTRFTQLAGYNLKICGQTLTKERAYLAPIKLLRHLRATKSS